MIRMLFLSFAALCALLLPASAAGAAEKSIYTSPYVSFSEDGRAWTANAGDKNTSWYPLGERVSTGLSSSLREPGTGEHYYRAARQGTVPVGYWEVQWEKGQCVHNSYPVGENTYYGVPFGRQICQKPHYSGWVAYCADCQERISDAYFYMSREAAQSIETIRLGDGLAYFYLCPFCRNLEQGRSLSRHMCREISWNQYRVRYDANCDRYAGYMANSIHMYRNEQIYEGKAVTPMTHLLLNSYVRKGYLFQGWNTEPDGSGTGYGDGEEIWNLTDCDYNIDPKAGMVVLYAQWEAVESTLYLDPGGGSYDGSTAVTAVTRGYGDVYRVDETLIEPPEGHRVSFECNGGSKVPDMTGTMHFAEWSMKMPFHGNFREGVYTYESETGEDDLLTACYGYDSVFLPATVKPGESFGGWYYDAEFKLPAGAAGDRITPTKDMTLYARWVDLKLYARENYQAWEGKGAVDLSWNQEDDKDKWYLLYQSRDAENWNRIFRAEEIGEDKTVRITGSCVKSPQTFTVEDTGLYTLTAAGAQGGSYGDYAGGQGGSVTASFWLERGEILTFDVGGADGYNGGGKGDTYADGGGRTTVSSDRKGVLLVAGGGGGATEAEAGGAGGSQKGLLETDSSGENGDAGGGGGYRGGTAGERIVHHHVESCYRDSSYDGLAGAAVYYEADRHVHLGSEEDECDNCYQYELGRAGSRNNPIPVRGNTSANVQAMLWKQICRGGELWKDSCLRMYDQNGNCFFRRDLSDILDRKAVLRLIDRQDSAWRQSGTNVQFPGFNTEFIWTLPEKDEDDQNNGGYTKYCSVRNSDGTSEVRGEYKRDEWASVQKLWGKAMGSGYPLFPDYNFYATGDTGYHLENTPLFFVRNNGCDEAGVLLNYTVDIPAYVTGIYVEVLGRGQNAISHDAVKTLITEVSLKGGKKTVCGMTEGQVILSTPSCGGSSYVNEEYAYAFSAQAGVQKGDGSFALEAVSVGFTAENELEGVWAPDLAAPDAVDEGLVQKEGLAAGKILVTWEKPEDHGTVYYHRAESYFAGMGEALCRSNETVSTLTSGVKGYFYCVDGKSDTEVTAAEEYTEAANVTVRVGEEVCYLHLAAVDVADNVSDTIHIFLDADVAARPLHTEPLVMDEEMENVCPAGERSWYVRSDGTTPFTLQYGGYMDGMATLRYQINHAVFVSMSGEEASAACNRVSAANQALSEEMIRVPDSLLYHSAENEPYLTIYPYTRAWREDGNRRLSVTQKFTLEKAASGKRIEIYPRAGADWQGDIFYSAREEDRGHGLTLIGDGEPPVIRGMELLQNLDLIDRRSSDPVLSLTAEDSLSGVREFCLTIYNADNNCSRRFEPDEAGLIQVKLKEDDPLFSGDFTAVAWAVDNVGNETTVSEAATEFGLTAQVERILPPHDPVFQNGESGILTITVWGYPDYVEIEFPQEMTEQDPGLDRRFDYARSPRYCQEEQVQFMIPLYTPSNKDYKITVRAYKGERQLERYPELSIVEVSGTILDDFRTRLR